MGHEYGAIYYSPNSEKSFYVKKDQAFLQTYTCQMDYKYRNGWWRNGKATKSLDDVIQVHVSSLTMPTKSDVDISEQVGTSENQANDEPVEGTEGNGSVPTEGSNSVPTEGNGSVPTEGNGSVPAEGNGSV